MKLTPLLPAMPDEGGRPRWSFAASAAAHGLVLLALLLAVSWRPRPEGGGAPSYDLVFESPQSGSPSTNPTDSPKQALPPIQPATTTPPPDAALGIPAPTPLTAPDPQATASPPLAAAPLTAPPLATPPLAAPAPQPAPAAAPTPAPQLAPRVAPAPATPPPVALALPDQPASIPLPAPEQAPHVVERPAVRLEIPPTDQAEAAPEPIMPQPPPPLPPAEPRPARPAPRQAPRPLACTLSNPMDLSLAPSAAPRPAARGVVASRSLDLTAREQAGSSRSDPYAQIRAANASAGWNNGLMQYWLQHRYYPEQARANGEEGSVTIQLTVNRLGKVTDVEVLSRSGSQWLDLAAVATWRNAQLPPFTNEMREDHITFPIPINYYLIR